ncbi:MAG: type II toxin-antitoxin system RelE/ParE family toxin [Chitinophagales bacterium]|nr:type II toxin-antitoxin system RelE/ParE family toxin [Chitinophagales bacterium]
MLLKEKWTTQAVDGYEKIIAYILQRWTAKEALAFIEVVEKSILLIRRLPFIHPESQSQQGIRRCVIRKKTSLYYCVKPKLIEIIAEIDNRIDPSKIIEQLK